MEFLLYHGIPLGEYQVHLLMSFAIQLQNNVGYSVWLGYSTNVA